jgi:holo-[acyl-carrier protein] synthase
MLGVDVVDVARFRRVLERSPRLEGRFFTERERADCAASADPPLHLAATFAAKEAVMKATSTLPAAAACRRIEIRRSEEGAPSAVVDDRTIPISISHDGPVVVAIALDLPALRPEELI